MEDFPFFQALLENPDDEELRLVYSDWLEEQGDPRAELIRVQWERAKLEREEPRARYLFRRELELIIRYKDLWFPLRKDLPTWNCHLGFMDEIYTSPSHLLPIADQFFNSQPVRILKLRVGPEHVDDLVALPYLSRVSKLFLLLIGCNETHLLAIANSSLSRWVYFLGLERCLITEGAMAALCASSSWEKLKRLDLSRSVLSEATVTTFLAKAPFLSRLEILELRPRVEYQNNWQQPKNYLPTLGEKAIRSLIEYPSFENLVYLNLGGNPISEELRTEAQLRFGQKLIFQDYTRSWYS